MKKQQNSLPSMKSSLVENGTSKTIYGGMPGFPLDLQGPTAVPYDHLPKEETGNAAETDTGSIQLAIMASQGEAKIAALKEEIARYETQHKQRLAELGNLEGQIHGIKDSLILTKNKLAVLRKDKENHFYRISEIENLREKAKALLAEEEKKMTMARNSAATEVVR